MNLVQYIAFRLDEAIEMLMNSGKSKDECACYLMDFKRQLFKPEEVIVDGDEMRSLPEIKKANIRE
jgi:hypothetical protein